MNRFGLASITRTAPTVLEDSRSCLRRHDRERILPAPTVLEGQETRSVGCAAIRRTGWQAQTVRSRTRWPTILLSFLTARVRSIDLERLRASCETRHDSPWKTPDYPEQ